jgi:hypothetical protein
VLFEEIEDPADLRRLEDPEGHARALGDLFDAVQSQLSPAEAIELSHLGLDDHRLFAAGVLAAYADRRLVLTRDTRRAAIRLLNR